MEDNIEQYTITKLKQKKKKSFPVPNPSAGQTRKNLEKNHVNSTKGKPGKQSDLKAS